MARSEFAAQANFGTLSAMHLHDPYPLVDDWNDH
jgi:hypothetical protein